jgi:hypothetical protein
MSLPVPSGYAWQFIVFPASRHLGFHSAAHQLVGIWTTAKCIAMLFAHQLMRMCGPIETKMAAALSKVS